MLIENTTMNALGRKIWISCMGLVWGGLVLQAQTVRWISSCEGNVWTQTKVKLVKNVKKTPDLSVGRNDSVVIFKAWGTCFNELGWDALNVLPGQDKEDILKRLFSPEGDLCFTLGRFPMNANDFSRNWYSCDEVPGDFELKYFNIDRDKTSLVPYIKSAQRYNPHMTFWISPWSPPSWMKINQDYPVRSDKYNNMDPKKDYYLFGNRGLKTEGVFPAELAETDFFIQDPRYLSAYANFFCKFVSAYKELGIPIKTVMFQNESWSYTPYPGCAWTPEGIVRFNVEYLGPALKKEHPDVKLYFGTINTNRYEVIEKVLDDPRMPETIQGIGLQWEGGQLLARLRAKYPEYKYVQTESECGWGAFDWKAGEHTFDLINHYLGNGCEEYTFWNPILADEGISPWGWKQNALIRVDSQQANAVFTPEYYAVKHYAQFLKPGTTIMSFKPVGEDRKPILVVQTSEGKTVIVAGNFQDTPQQLIVKLEEKCLEVTLQAHSFNTFECQLK